MPCSPRSHSRSYFPVSCSQIGNFATNKLFIPHPTRTFYPCPRSVISLQQNKPELGRKPLACHFLRLLVSFIKKHDRKKNPRVEEILVPQIVVPPAIVFAQTTVQNRALISPDDTFPRCLTSEQWERGMRYAGNVGVGKKWE